MRTANILLATVLLASAISEPSGAETPKLDWLEGDLGLVLNVVGMTFVASEGSRNDILLRAERARFYPEREVAELEQVEVEVASGGDRIGFEMRCDRGQLNLSTRDFLACDFDCQDFDTSGCRNFVCGNTICEPAAGEDCLACPGDCNGVQSGNPNLHYCCGDGDGDVPVDCSDSRCTGGGNTCEP